MQVGVAGNFDVERCAAEWMPKYGVTGVMVKCCHGLAIDTANETDLLTPRWNVWKDKYPFSVWHFATAEHPESQASKHVAQTRRFGKAEAGNRWTVINNEFDFNAVPGQGTRYVQQFRAEAPTMGAAIQPEGSHFDHPILGPLPVHAEYAPFVGAAFRSLVQGYRGDMVPFDLWKPWYGQARDDGYGAGFPSSYCRVTFGCAGDNQPPASWYGPQLTTLKAKATEHQVSFPRGGVIYLGETVTEDVLAAISASMKSLGMLRT